MAQKRRYHSRPQRRAEAGPVVELAIERPAHGGVAVAHGEDGRVVFVRHAIPGEVVRAQVTLEQKKIAWAEVVEVLKPSSERVESVWPAAGRGGVGGAELAHVSLEGQLRWKEAVLRDQLRRIGGEAVGAQVEALGTGALEVRPTPGDAGLVERLGWRSRLECVIDSQGRPCMHGYRDKALIPLTDMPLAMPEILATGIFDEGSLWRSLWQAGDRVRVVAETGVENPRVLVQIGERVFDADGSQTDDLYLRHAITVGGTGFHYRVRMQGFWQAHREGGEVLATNVAEFAALKEGDAVLELYSGAGLFSAVLADQVGESGRVLTIEGDEDAVADAAVNTAAWGTVDPFVGWIDEEALLSAVGELGRLPDCVVLDPPRAGAGREVCERLASIGSERVVLVSCDVAAGARDLKALVAGGYRIEDMRVWDLYPYTHHMEIVTLLVKV